MYTEQDTGGSDDGSRGVTNRHEVLDDLIVQPRNSRDSRCLEMAGSDQRNRVRSTRVEIPGNPASVLIRIRFVNPDSVAEPGMIGLLKPNHYVIAQFSRLTIAEQLDIYDCLRNVGYRHEYIFEAADPPRDLEIECDVSTGMTIQKRLIDARERKRRKLAGEHQTSQRLSHPLDNEWESRQKRRITEHARIC